MPHSTAPSTEYEKPPVHGTGGGGSNEYADTRAYPGSFAQSDLGASCARASPPSAPT